MNATLETAKATSHERKSTIKYDTTQCVEDYMRKAILSGLYPQNSFLPPQRQLAKELGAGHWTVRMALDHLAEAGLLESSRGRGTRVLPAKERTVKTKVAFIHTHADELSRRKIEPYRISRGITRRLQALGYPISEFDIVNDIASKEFSESSVQPLIMKELPAATEFCDAFIFIEANHPSVGEFAVNLERQKIPVVIANMETNLPVSATCIDHEAISFHAVETLASFGHHRIGFLSTNPSICFYGKALEGYQKGIAARNLPSEESLISFCDYSSSLYAYHACKKLLQQPNPPTAIVAARDCHASGACHAITEAGIEVGRDISVIGFDDVSWDGPEQILTTYKEPCDALGAKAVDILIDRIHNGWKPPEQRILDAPLILRRTVGPPGGNGTAI